MTKKLAALAVLLLSGGCRMCANTCDYSAPVPGGPPLGPIRSGSNLSGGIVYETAPVPMPAVVDDYGAQLTPPPIETVP